VIRHEQVLLVRPHVEPSLSSLPQTPKLLSGTAETSLAASV